MEYLDGMEKKQWANSEWFKGGIVCYGRRASQSVESINSRLLPVRRDDPLRAIEKIVELQTEMLEKWRKQARDILDSESLYRPYAIRIFDEALQRADSYNAIVQGESNIVFVKGYTISS